MHRVRANVAAVLLFPLKLQLLVSCMRAKKVFRYFPTEQLFERPEFLRRCRLIAPLRKSTLCLSSNLLSGSKQRHLTLVVEDDVGHFD